METPGDEVDMSDDDIERLSAVYRATLKDPPYDATDAALLRAAARRARALPLRRLVYAVAAGLLAALGVAAGLRLVTSGPQPSSIDMRTAAERGPVQAHPRPRDRDRETAALKEVEAFSRQTIPLDNYLTHATLNSVSPQRGPQQRDPEVLLKTSVLAQTPSELTCGTAPAVDLNVPGALAGVKAGRPGDYSKIIRIIAGVTRHPELDVARWISAAFHAADVSYFPLWLTSLPPKRRLSFCLHGTRYEVVLTITRGGARVSSTDYRDKSRSPSPPQDAQTQRTAPP